MQVHSRAKRSDIARAAGVAESTVSRALSGSTLIAPDTVARITRIAREMGYVPDSQAALFARRKPCRLGFVVRAFRSFPPFSRPYFPALLDGAVTACEEHGYVVINILDYFNEQPKDLVRLVQSREVDGLLLPLISDSDLRLPLLRQHEVPFVLINNSQPGLYCVDSDPLPGMRRAFDHVVNLGHRTLGYIAGDMEYANARDRLDVFNRLVGEFQLSGSVVAGNFSRTSGYAGAGALLQGPNPPTCIMTAADRQALGVLDYCRQHGVAVPGKVSVIGFDNLEQARLVSPTLTTVDNPITRTGAAAALLLIDILEKKRKKPLIRQLPTDFVIRQSSGPITPENVTTVGTQSLAGNN